QFDLLADLMELGGAESFRVLAYRRAATRMRETAISIAQLALDGRAKELQGIGKTIEEKIVQIVEEGEIQALTKKKSEVPPEVVSVLREHPAAIRVSEAGSVRRRKETFRDLDLIATATDPAELTDYFTKLAWVVEVAAQGDTKATVISNEGLRFDLRVVPPAS